MGQLKHGDDLLLLACHEGALFPFLADTEVVEKLLPLLLIPGGLAGLRRHVVHLVGCFSAREMQTFPKGLASV
ncbi:hypothetical protein T8T21_03855 [Limimaricola variabilis]|uniref:hypothetical protein n=1 Tax=Limimaricola variabilis TaxID=1492771 RepID=UPI002AC9839E|nr:hypothetical protein [Limimaricola variabilis]WPY95270.1 hypothetical protein T8T21_03855 [Limimaricola variabilis]